MAIHIVPYEAPFQPAVQAFNERLCVAGSWPFSVGNAPLPLSPDVASTHPIQFHHFLAVDDDSAVRGAFFIRTQEFLIRGRVMTVGHYSAPLSEGIADKRYTAVGPLMLGHALRQQPLLFAMGMGGMDRPLPRMLKGMGWTVLQTPFYYRILNAGRFLRNAGPLRSTRSRRLVAGAAAWSGIGNLAIRSAQRLRTKASVDTSHFQSERITDFGAWGDAVWQATSGMYSMSAVRDAAYLRCIYPRQEAPFYGLRIAGAGDTAGWVQLLDCKPKQTSYFGSMKVMALVDGLAAESAAAPLVAKALHFARESGADLLISNQMHEVWKSALRDNGFWQGPSNYLLALSKQLAGLLEPLGQSAPLIHFNRGDGDGIVNLLGEG